MRVIRSMVVALALVLCLASASSYHDATTARPLTNDTWFIDASGNGFTSSSQVMEYTYRKASEVCPSGFDVIDNQRSSTEHDVTFDGGKTYQTVSKPDAVLVVRCHRTEMNGTCRGELCPRARARSVAPAATAVGPDETLDLVSSESTSVAATPQAVPREAKLLVFGDADHKKFLGCVCGEFDTDSILNKFGTYGSRYQTDSIWNKYGNYGSPYSDTSACNQYANNPPVVVTDAGVFVGYLTLNQYKTGAITNADVLIFLEKSVCEK